MTGLPHALRRVLPLVALLCALHASAGEPLTLSDAVDLALEHNLTLEAARQDHEAARWGVRSAWASLLPSVSLTSTARRVDPDTYERANSAIDFLPPDIDVEPFLYETTYETAFNASMPVFNGGRLWGGVALSAASSRAARHALESERRDVVVRTKSAFFDVLRAESLRKVSLDAVGASERRVASSERMLELGVRSRADLLRWQVQLAEDRRALVDAENAVSLARSALAATLGRPLDTEFELEDVSRLELEARCRPYSDLIENDAIPELSARRLLSSNPGYLALGDAAEIERHAVTIARGAFLPALNAQATYGWKADGDIEPDDEVAWSVTAFLEVPVFTGFRNLSEYQQARRSQLAAERRREDGERMMVLGLRNAVATLRSRLEGLEAADRLVAQSRQHFESMDRMYDQGMAQSTDVAEARVLLDRSRVGYINALYDCFIGLAEVESLVGDAPALGQTNGETR